MDTIKLLCEFLMDTELSPFIWRYYINEFKSSGSMQLSHCHKAVEIIFVSDGSGFMKFDDDVVKIIKNNCLIISSEKKHQFYVKENSSCTLINIHIDFNNTILSNIILKNDDETNQNNLLLFSSVMLKNKGYIKLADNNRIKEIMSKIIMEMNSKLPKYDALVKMYFFELFIILSRIMEENQNQYKDDINKYTVDVKKFIEVSLSNELSPDIISKTVYISANYLLHIFKNDTGYSLMEYVNLRRIEKSKEMLKNSDRTITGIALEVGIQSSQYFSTIFKRYTDMTPNQYRKISRLTNNSNSNIFI